MKRDWRPVVILLLLPAAFLLLLVVTVGPLAAGRPRPTELRPAASPDAVVIADRLHPLGVAPFPPVHDLPSLGPDAAARLSGVRRRWRVTMAGPPDRRGRWDVYEVLPENDPQGVLYLEAGPEVRGFVVVDATLQVIHHPAIAAGPVRVAAFTEYRLVDAVRVAP